jgi:diguanylate cyclase (GGDEF)-like protein/PAS domain S-box-containing protein
VTPVFPILKINPAQAMHYLISSLLFIFLLNVAAADDLSDIVSTRYKSDPVVQLTATEQAWLANHSKIKIAFDGSLPPYSFINDSGQLEGIAVDVMNILSKRLGIKFETYPNTSWNKLYEAAAAHKVDVVSTMVNRPDRRQLFIFTQPYLIKSLVIMTKRDNVAIKNQTDLVRKRVAMVKGYQFVDRLIKELPSVTPYFVDSMLDGLKTVSTEKADAAITFMATASYLQTKYLLTDLKIAAFYDLNSANDNINESIAVRNDWPILADILQKALVTLSEEEMQNIHAKWIPGIKPSIDYELIWTIVAAFVTVFVLLLLWIALVRRQNKKIKLSKSEVQTTNKILLALKDDLENLVVKRTAELNSSEYKFRSLVENLRDEYFFYQRDYEGIFTYISPSLTNILGYTADEFMAHYHDYLTDNPINLKIDEHFKSCTQCQHNPPYQLEIYSAQKDIHWLEVTDTPIYDEYSKCIGVDGIVHDITLRKQADDRLRWLSHYDELTGLANRRLFADQLQYVISMAYRTNQSVALFYLDLDRFKFVNDTMGHAVGDEVLKETACRILSTLRDSDIAARLGGDEFAILLPETDAAGAAPVAEKILKKLREPYIIDELEFTLGGSVGIAVYPRDTNSSEALIHFADTAMYHAKQGKLGVSFYSESMQQKKVIG